MYKKKISYLIFNAFLPFYTMIYSVLQFFYSALQFLMMKIIIIGQMLGYM